MLRWPDVPVNSTLFLDTSAEAVGHPRGSFLLTICRECGLAFNAAFCSSLPEYSTRNTESQFSSAAFRTFATGLASTWIADYHLEGSHVLEIGSGSRPDFLQLFCKLSGGTGTGLDPAGEEADRGPVSVLRQPFDRRWAEPADAVICRHTLEHIGDVSGFLEDLREWGEANPDAIYFFEVPDFATVLERHAYWDLYYEHASYFTGDVLSTTFERHGFDVLSCRSVFDEKYLVLEARSTPARSGGRRADVEAIIRSTERLSAGYDKFAALCERRFSDLRADGPVLIWQAGSKAAALLTDPAVAATVTALVDVDNAKRGKYLVGAGLPVVAPEDVAGLGPAHIVLMNASYLEEVTRICSDAGVDASVHVAENLFTADGSAP